MLWVYEGQTEFWGRVLAARSGLRTIQQTLDQFALDAHSFQSKRSTVEDARRQHAEHPRHAPTCSLMA